MDLNDAPPPRGSLYLIGGAEDRGEHKRVLGRLLQIAGGPGARIVLLTAASTRQAEVQQAYARAFAALGVPACAGIAIEQRAEADDAAHARSVLEADVVFMSGGDQRRLTALVGGTRLEQAIHRALHERGACIAGTSAGAAAMSAQMLSDGSDQAGAPPDGAWLSPGLGLLHGLVVDQHFSQRQRLGRLLSIVTRQPQLLGLGIDEDTALHLRPGQGLEVLGGGDVTLVDAGAPGGAMAPAVHVLPAGTQWRSGGMGLAPAALLARVVGATVTPATAA